MSCGLEIKDDDPKTILLLWEGVPWRRVSRSLFFPELKKLPSKLTWEAFFEHFTLIEEKVGRRYACFLLSRKALFSGDLQQRLVSKGISLLTAQAVVGFCQERGYVNDVNEITRLVAKELKKGRSNKAVFFKLKTKKGVDAALLQEHLQSFSESDALQKWLQKNLRKVDLHDPHERRKLIAKLCRKGFSLETIFKELGIS